VLVGDLHNVGDMLSGAGVHDHVDVALELAVTEAEDLTQTGTVRVHNSLPLLEGASAEALGFLKFAQELVLNILGLIAVHVLLLRLRRADVKADSFLGPVVELGKGVA